jgi:hypothetical protein
MRTMLLDSSNSFARDDLDGGITALVQMIRALPPSAYYDDLALRMLHSCADGLEACGVARPEYLIVALHVLHSGVRG